MRLSLGSRVCREEEFKESEWMGVVEVVRVERCERAAVVVGVGVGAEGEREGERPRESKRPRDREKTQETKRLGD